MKLVFLLLIFLPSFANAETVTIGSKKFTESVILGELVRLRLETSGVDATHREQLGGTRVLWSAIERGDIDIYPEYTGTIAEEILSGKVDADDFAGLRAQLAKSNIAMTDPIGFENTYGIGLLEDVAEKKNLRKISDLKRYPDLKFGFGNEFLDREDGWKALKRAYQLPHTNTRGLDHDLAYIGIGAGEIEAMDVYTTDAEIPYYKIRVLTDDLSHFPKYEAVFLYRLDQKPAIATALQSFVTSIDARKMQALNRAVKIDKRTETEVASDHLNVVASGEESGRAARILQRTYEHLFLVLVSLSAAIFLAVPLGIFAFRRRKFGQVVLAGVGIVQTIPSLALLVLMIPLLGIGTVPAIAALFLYSLLPIVRNTHSGFAQIDPALLRAARGIGLADREVARFVELPLALPSVLSGIKTAAVINVGTATLGALIGAGGYGQPILTGIRLDDVGLIFEGAIPAAILALLVQWTFDLAERAVVSRGLRLT